jgi:putative glutamine amidotransferase
MMKVIGITQSDSKFHLYAPWMQGEDADVEIITLSYETGNLEDLKKCDGIVLTGGIDTHPKFYNNPRVDYPGGPKEFNEPRDIFELKVFEYACEHEVPVLAICRGMQLVNCALGGDLVQDLEEKGKADHKKQGEFDDGIHEIFVNKTSLFYKITNRDKGQVNSAHHQGLGRIADDLMISAVSPDDVPEAIEYGDKTNKPFLLCVQWHPERLKIEDTWVPFSKNIRTAFLSSIKK